MKVTIPASKHHAGMDLVTLVISDVCPTCGGPRGRKFGTHSFDGSRRLNCDGWNNPCGHVDTYENVRIEGVPAQYVPPCEIGRYEDGTSIWEDPDLPFSAYLRDFG